MRLYDLNAVGVQRLSKASEAELIAAISTNELRALAARLVELDAHYQELYRQQREICRQAEETAGRYRQLRKDLIHKRLQAEGLTVCMKCIRLKRVSSCRLLYMEGGFLGLSGASFDEAMETHERLREVGHLCRTCQKTLRREYRKSKPSDDYWRRFYRARQAKIGKEYSFEYLHDSQWVRIPAGTEIKFPPSVSLLEEFAEKKQWARDWLIPPFLMSKG